MSFFSYLFADFNPTSHAQLVLVPEKFLVLTRTGKADGCTAVVFYGQKKKGGFLLEPAGWPHPTPLMLLLCAGRVIPNKPVSPYAPYCYRHYRGQPRSPSFGLPCHHVGPRAMVDRRSRTSRTVGPVARGCCRVLDDNTPLNLYSLAMTKRRRSCVGNTFVEVEKGGMP